MAGLAFVLLSGGGGDGDKGNQPAKKTATPEAKKTATPTPTAEKTSTPTPRDRDGHPDRHRRRRRRSEPSGNEPASNNPSTLQLQAFNLNKAGKSEEALPVAQKAVRLGCKGNASVSPCGYALFELAKAQRGTGDAKGAVKTLEERLQRYPDDQRAAVEAELKKARPKPASKGRG